jgi:hypothetical protein
MQIWILLDGVDLKNKFSLKKENATDECEIGI